MTPDTVPATPESVRTEFFGRAVSDETVQDYRKATAATRFIGCREGWQLPFADSLADAAYGNMHDICLHEWRKGKHPPDTSLTDFGNKLFGILRGSTVIDLGCGDPAKSTAVPGIATMAGAARYIGIDMDPKLRECNDIVRIEDRSVPVARLRGDILGTLARARECPEAVVNMSGIELAGKTRLSDMSEQSQLYADLCMKELRRIGPKAIIIGPATNFFDPATIGYRPVYVARNHLSVGTGGEAINTIWMRPDIAGAVAREKFAHRDRMMDVLRA